MKKIGLLILGIALGGMVQAQKLNIQNALNALSENDFAKAKNYIDKATEHEKTSTDGDAWLVKGLVYQCIGANVESLPIMSISLNGRPYALNIKSAAALSSSNPDALNVAVDAYQKHIQYSKKYNKQEVQPLVYGLMIQNFNSGIAAYNAKDYAGAIKNFNGVTGLSEMDGGKLFSGMSQVDTINAQAAQYRAYCGYYNVDKGGDMNSALKDIQYALASPISNTPEIYQMAAELYRRNGNQEKYTATIDEGLKKYPGHEGLTNEKLNNSLTSGNEEKAIKDFEAAVAKDPNRAELHFNLGAMYAKMSEGAKEESKKYSYFDKAKSAYDQAIKLEKKADYVYNLGVLYFNKAKYLTDLMNAENDDDKYEAIKVQRDKVMGDAIPVLEEAKKLVKSSGVNDEQLATYRNILMGLKQAYAVMNQLDKVKEIDAELGK